MVFGRTFLLLSITTLLSACSFKVKHTFDLGTNAKQKVQDVKNGVTTSKEAIKSISSSVKNKVSDTLGSSASSELPPLPPNKEDYSVELIENSSGQLELKVMGQATAPIILDLDNLTLKLAAGTFNMIRDYSDEDYFYWWFQNSDQELIEVFMESATSQTSIQGILTYYYQ